MTQYLTFTLYAPMAALGGVVVGERRTGTPRLARSALVGLLGAALGVRRDNEPALQALAAGYGFATRTDAPGRVLTDYHTAQVPPADRKRRHFTRRSELSLPKHELETVLTRREYRTDAIYAVALWRRETAPYALEQLAHALRQPQFVLYLGRKSCPLALPVAPQLVEADHILAAFAAREPAWPEQRLAQILRASPGDVATDEDGASGNHAKRRERRRDAIVHRGRWQFGLRDELVLLPMPETPA